MVNKKTLNYHSYVMIGLTLALFITIGFLIALLILFLFLHDFSDRILLTIIIGSVILGGWVIFGTLYLFWFRRIVYEFSEVGIKKIKDKRVVLAIPWEKVLCMKYDDFEWYDVFSMGPETADLIIEYKEDEKHKKLQINLFFKQVMEIKKIYYNTLEVVRK